MSKNKKVDDFDLIKNQFKSLYNHLSHFKRFTDMVYADYREIKDGSGNIISYEIGKRLEKMSYDSYLERLNHVIDDSEYSVLFDDFSFASLFYQFDKDKKLVYSSLNFVPYYEDADELKNNKYVRIDYEEQGHLEFIHTYSHMHLTVNKNDIRLPIDHVLTPNEFIYFVLVHIYHELDNINKLDLNSNLSPVVMSNDEIKKMHISFGSNK